jgi:serine/threonine-protein kinase
MSRRGDVQDSFEHHSSRSTRKEEPIRSSRYELLLKIGSGGMASVYVGRVVGTAGFSRLFAVKRAHPHLVQDPASQKMLLREAQLASRLTHANVAAVLDVERTEEELLLIMDYVEGASLCDLIDAGTRSGRLMPARVALRIVLDACAGLAAAHELGDHNGGSLGFLHRDVSPHNILVGIDGTARISDFGLARGLTASRSSVSSAHVAGKLGYIAPEVIERGCFSVKSDLFAMGVVTWELLARQSLFRVYSEPARSRRVLTSVPPRLSEVLPGIDAQLDRVVQRALERDPSRRYGSIREFAAALEGITRRADWSATPSEVSTYVRRVVGAELTRRRDRIRSLDDPEPPRSALVRRGHWPQAELPQSSEDLRGYTPQAQVPRQAAPEPASDRPISGAYVAPVPRPMTASQETPTLPSTMAALSSRSTQRRPAAAVTANGEARRMILAICLGSALAIGVFFARPWGRSPDLGARLLGIVGAVTTVARAEVMPAPPPVTSSPAAEGRPGDPTAVETAPQTDEDRRDAPTGDEQKPPASSEP